MPNYFFNTRLPTYLEMFDMQTSNVQFIGKTY